MKSVVKRNFVRGPSGRILASSTERLVEDETGRVHVSQQNTPLWCPGCRRPLKGFEDLRGSCDYCRRTGTCHTCETRCRACSRRLCTGCRRGFAGSSLATVCPACLPGLVSRQRAADQAVYQRARLQRQLAIQRHQLRIWTQKQRLALAKAARNAAVLRDRRKRRQALIQAQSRVQQLLQ